MLKFMRSRYTETETKKRWNKTAKLYFKWLREEGDLGGRANLLSSNMTIYYAVCAFYEAVDRDFSGEDFNTALRIRAKARIYGLAAVYVRVRSHHGKAIPRKAYSSQHAVRRRRKMRLLVCG